jgi:hypothetical protein
MAWYRMATEFTSGQEVEGFFEGQWRPAKIIRLAMEYPRPDTYVLDFDLDLVGGSPLAIDASHIRITESA